MDNSLTALPENIVIFDGVCNLCEFSVNFIFEHDTVGHFSFTPAQSPPGASLLKHFGINTSRLDTVVLVRGDRAFTRSAAAIEIASRLDMPWNLLTLFQAVPEFLRDVIYDLIAQNRYQLFGKKDQCMLPSEGLRRRFLEQLPG
ncbi:thiol-disulfide oxidoreductase DCC family protein [Chlorobium sp. KB01]|uniref:thiol-disulfide oxidoreductase DCC family protein n=1 Tax=Chlorobium sp. KB01 TaxID=1917528 RepID=UPI00097814E6|nr:thiol-disulfide oxidoreductase DCC family protein [Chlorobium sp. KB01]